jgi:hypothetical protein
VLLPLGRISHLIWCSISAQQCLAFSIQYLERLCAAADNLVGAAFIGQG